MELALRCVGTGGTALGVVGILASVGKLDTWQMVSLWLLLAVVIAVLTIDVWKTIATRPKTYEPNSEAIADYLQRWLESGGRAAIFTRDMSWARQNTPVFRCLSQKARNGDLTICAAPASAIAEDLKANGAEYFPHPADFTPTLRFTIVDAHKAGARVAIGLVEKGKHVIREYSVHDPFVLDLAQDLIEFARASKKAA